MNTLIHHSIIENARTLPHRAAFRCRDSELSYSELLSKACRLANWLIDHGVEPMDRVGIYMGKQIELPVATYGTLLAGAAYVPIDPNAPIDRIQSILEDCAIDVIVSHPSKGRQIEKLLSNAQRIKGIVGFVPQTTLPVHSIDWEALDQERDTLPDRSTTEDDLAYIMYTSGSTGAPKGLMHTHRSGLAYARYSADLYGVRSDDILGNHAPLHFDISTFEFLTGPLVGATSVLIPEEELLFAESLAERIENERLTFWYSVPLALIQLATRADLSQRDFSSLRWVLFGGEPFPPKYARQLQSLIPSARFSNIYGPAEVNQCSYYHLPELTEADEQTPIPIGSIWKGAKALVVSSDDTPVPQGELGELLVHSSTMMQGYWGRESLNAASFYEEVLAPGFKRRYYRTGDLVHVDPDGRYHFAGRKDRQIKLRGYRIELDEIEAAFAAQPNVEEAAAFCVEGTGLEEKSLHVVITLKPNATLTEKELLSEAQRILPRYAVPQSLTFAKSFPRTTSGKIDRTALATTHAAE